MKFCLSRRGLFLTTLILSVTLAQGQDPLPYDTPQHRQWADSILLELTLEEQIAQLLMPPVYAHASRENWAEAEAWVKNYHIGGVIAMQGAPAPYVERIERLQANSKVPLLISTDGEWGLGMRIDSTRSWPRALTFGAANDTALTEAMGQEVGRSLKSMGFHVNFAPVVDVNSNPNNPVIGSRSFGSNVELVGQQGSAYARGMQTVGVLATAKHFPGHGDTDADSHYALPVIGHGKARLDSVELEPFKQLIHDGVGAVMAAHLYIPALDSTPNLPSTLSSQIVDSLLRRTLGFKGLVFTDAMTMKGFTSFSSTSTPHVDALLAGNDILLFPEHPEHVIEEVMQAIKTGRMEPEWIAEKCHRVLRAKSWCGVANKPEKQDETEESERIHQSVLGQSLTVLKNGAPHWPFDNQIRQVSHLFIGFEQEIADMVDGSMMQIMSPAFNSTGTVMESAAFEQRGTSTFSELLRSEPDWAILHLGGTSHSAARSHGITDAEIETIQRCAALAHERNIPFGLVIYGSPYVLDRLGSCIALSDAVMVAYQDDGRTANAVAQALTGAGPAGGHLPVETKQYRQGFGLPWMGRTRLGLASSPISTKAAIDSIALGAIEGGAIPGCRVLVAHKGLIVHDGVYGTLDGETPVKPSSVYDLASITKIAATVLSLMHLEEAGALDIGRPLADYLDELEGTTMGSRTIQDVLAHRAGLKSWIPFYLEAMEDSTAFSPRETPVHNQRVSDACFMRPAWQDSIWTHIVESEVDPVGTHRYSDLGYYALQRIIEQITGQPLDEFASSTFYSPAGWSSLGYSPTDRFETREIAPTEEDTLFRKVVVRGEVHDPGAAMLNGVAGHAGLFSNAYDLARLMYMLRLGGYYGGTEFFKPSTIQRWVQRVDPDEEYRKACGFDRPAHEPDAGPTCNHASESSFGHSGFTGTLAWADPDHDLIFVFLSNRTFPDAENRKLIEWDVRTNIQREVYKAYAVPSRFEPLKK